MLETLRLLLFTGFIFTMYVNKFLTLIEYTRE